MNAIFTAVLSITAYELGRYLTRRIRHAYIDRALARWYVEHPNDICWTRTEGAGSYPNPPNTACTH